MVNALLRVFKGNASLSLRLCELNDENGGICLTKTSESPSKEGHVIKS